MKRFLSPLLILLFLFAYLSVSDSFSQRTDFEEYPQLDANYSHLDLELDVRPGPEIRGDATYRLRLYRERTDTLRLDAIRMDIDTVEWEGSPVDYIMDDDQLVILLPEGLDVDTEYSLRVRYRAQPVFGLFESNRRTVWTSGKPGSVRHWLPVADHPRNSFRTDVSLIYPAGKTAVFNGHPSEGQVESVDSQSTRFRSGTEMPATALGFAIGYFEQTRTTTGRHPVTLYSENDLLSSLEKEELLDEVFSAFQTVERSLEKAYAYPALHLVVLEDDKWESRSYRAGLVFGFHRLGNLQGQLVQGVASQWLGVEMREERWADAGAIMLLQTWLHDRLANSARPDVAVQEDLQMFYEGDYGAFSSENRHTWRAFYESEEARLFRNLLDKTGPDLMTYLPPVIRWQDFARLMYEHTGLYLAESPDPAHVVPPVDETSQIPVYEVVYHLDEQLNRLRLEFTAQDLAVDELVTVIVEEVTFSDVRTREITFTGQTDEVSLNVNAGIENLKLSVSDDVEVRLLPDKPFMFWIYQLRNDEDPARRAEAAIHLREFADNPDLQLALLDIVNAENDEQVYAEGLRTLAAVTDGASGTDQLFRQRYSPDANPKVQAAIVEAYANYPGNETVISQLRSIILNAASVEVQERAVASLSSLSEPDRFLAHVETILSNDPVSRVGPMLLLELAEMGQSEAAAELAEAYLDARVAYDRRVQVLDMLLMHDRSDQRWLARIERISLDDDPRMRYRTLDGLQFLEADDREQLIAERLYEEYDARVLRRLNTLSE